jgi:hypothetical protein
MGGGQSGTKTENCEESNGILKDEDSEISLQVVDDQDRQQRVRGEGVVKDGLSSITMSE